MRRAMASQLVLVGRCAGRRHDEGADHGGVLAHLALGDRDIGDARRMAQGRFDLGGRNAIALRVHEIVGAPVQPDIAVGIQFRDVAADEPLAAKDLGFGFGALPVAEHQAGVGAMDRDQAAFARQRAASRRLRAAG